jgi:deferrochelatase/peroxidase EfeB
LADDDGVERGLHFLCYQTSIEEQFEKIQLDWANNSLAPLVGGHDLIIGQDRDRRRTFDLLTPDGSSQQTLTAPRQWVVPTGGGYFFTPSISAIRDVLCRMDELV